MKATIKTQGQQFSVSEGDVLIVNRYQKTEAGAIIEIKEVLTRVKATRFRVGAPYLPDASVTAKILENKRGKKVIVFKKKKRKATRKSAGHRQELSVINRVHQGVGEFSHGTQERPVHRKQRTIESFEAARHQKFGNQSVIAGKHHRPAARHEASSGKNIGMGATSPCLPSGRRREIRQDPPPGPAFETGV